MCVCVSVCVHVCVRACVLYNTDASLSPDLRSRDAAGNSSSSSTPTSLVCNIGHMTAALAPPTGPVHPYRCGCGSPTRRPLSHTSSLSVLLCAALVEEDLWVGSRHQPPKHPPAKIKPTNIHSRLLFSPPPWSLLLAQHRVAPSSPSCSLQASAPPVLSLCLLYP